MNSTLVWIVVNHTLYSPSVSHKPELTAARSTGSTDTSSRLSSTQTTNERRLEAVNVKCLNTHRQTIITRRTRTIMRISDRPYAVKTLRPFYGRLALHETRHESSFRLSFRPNLPRRRPYYLRLSTRFSHQAVAVVEHNVAQRWWFSIVLGLCSFCHGFRKSQFDDFVHELQLWLQATRLTHLFDIWEVDCSSRTKKQRTKILKSENAGFANAGVNVMVENRSTINRN